MTTNLELQLNATNAASLGSPTNSAALTAWNSAGGSLGTLGNFTGSGSYLAVDTSLNSLPSVQFAANAGGTSGQFLFNTTNFGANTTIIYVGRLNGGSNHRLVGGYSNNTLFGYWSGHQDTAYGSSFFGANPGTPGNPATTATHVYAVSVDASGNGTLYSGGALLGTGTGEAGPNGLVLGAGNGGGSSQSEFSSGEVGEVLVYNSVLSASQIQAISNYLANMWEGILPTATPVTISGGGTLDLNGVNQTIGSLNSSDPTTRVALGGATLTTGSLSTTDSFVGVISDSGAPAAARVAA